MSTVGVPDGGSQADDFRDAILIKGAFYYDPGTTTPIYHSVDTHNGSNFIQDNNGWATLPDCSSYPFDYGGPYPPSGTCYFALTRDGTNHTIRLRTGTADGPWWINNAWSTDGGYGLHGLRYIVFQHDSYPQKTDCETDNVKFWDGVSSLTPVPYLANEADCP